MQRIRGQKQKLLEALCSAVFFVAALPVHSSPQTLRIDGSLFNASGVPITGNRDVQIKAYDAATGGSAVWTSSVYTAAVSSGRFSIALDATVDTTSLTTRLAAKAASGEIWFEIHYDTGTADGDMDSDVTVTPRIRGKGSMFALVAAKADALTGVTATVAEMNRLAGVTGNIQSQINAAIAGGTLDSYVNLIDGATVSVDGSAGRVYAVTLAGNRLMENPTNLVAGRHYSFVVKQDATGGRKLSWSSSYKGTIPNITTPTLVSSGTGTVIGNMTDYGGLAAAFDGDTTQSYSEVAAKNDDTVPGTIGKDWGSGNTKLITRFTAYGTTDYGLSYNTGVIGVTLAGSQNNSTWTVLWSGTLSGYPGHVLDINSGIDTSTAYRYHRISIDPPSGQWSSMAELQFYEGLAAANTTATYPFVSDGTYLYYGVDPGGSSSGGNNSSTYTANRVIISDSNGSESASSVTSTELSYLGGVTAAIQTQINSIPSATTRVSRTGDTMTGNLGFNYSGVTPGRVAYIGTSRELQTSSVVDNAELDYLDGVTSNLGARINLFTNTQAGYLGGVTTSLIGWLGGVTSNIGSRLNLVNTSDLAYLSGVTSNIGAKINLATATEFGYLAGVTASIASKENLFTATQAGYLGGVTTSLIGWLGGVTANLQTQINAKATGANYVAKNGDTMSGKLFVGGANIGTSGAYEINGQTVLNSAASERTMVGVSAGISSSGSTQSTYVGVEAGGGATLVGDRVTAVGFRAGHGLTTGTDNTLVGYQAGKLLSGDENAFFGSSAGQAAADVHWSTMLGHNAGYSTNSGDYNTFIGNNAGYTNTSGEKNVFVGYYSGYTNGAGAYNVFMGNLSGRNNDSGTSNTFLGWEAGRSNTSASYNTYVGADAGYTNTTGTRNSYLGHYTGYNVAGGSDNTLIGYQAGDTVVGGARNVYVGSDADGLAGVSMNVAVGYAATVRANSSVQLGAGNNSTPNTLQFWDYNFLTSSGAATFASVNGVTAISAAYMNGLTANIQTQINAISPMATSVITGNTAGAVNNAYVVNSSSLVGVTLPATCAVGDRIKVVGLGTGGWKVVQQAGQSIDFSAGGTSASTGYVTTTGTGGYLKSLDSKAAVELLCRVANTNWSVSASDGIYSGDYVAGVSTYTSAGLTGLTIPSGVTRVTIKAWGGGGGGGEADSLSAAGGAGGAGAYAGGTFDVEPGQVLRIFVGGGGSGGTGGANGGYAGGGGGVSAVRWGATTLVAAAGGGGGGGAASNSASAGGAGGIGLCVSSTGGSDGSGTNYGVGGGAPSFFSPGAAGGGSATAGVGGQGGNGGNTPSISGGAGGGGSGGLGTNGSAGGGGGGGGALGGGGGGEPSSNSGAGGGGSGGSGGGPTCTEGSGTTAGNSGDSDYAGSAGAGGAGGTGAGGAGSAGTTGRIVVKW